MNIRRKKIIQYVLGMLLLGFIALSLLVYMFPTTLLDREFSEEVQELDAPALETAMKTVSWFGYMPNSMIMVLIASLIFFVCRLRKEAIYTFSTLSSGAVSASVKLIVDRPRPAEPLVRIIEKANHQSFPSGHVLFYVVFFGFLIVMMYHLKSIPNKIRYFVAGVSAGFIFCVPFSRIYLGAHWFTDVLGGFMLGLVCLFIISYLYFRKRA